jgi:hypothetical protein
MELLTSDVGKTSGERFWSSFSFRLQPSLYLLHAVAGYSFF